MTDHEALLALGDKPPRNLTPDELLAMGIPEFDARRQQKPTVGSLFSGIGGMDLGLERAGFEVRWQVEIDEYCRRVLAKHWPNVPRYGDIRDLRGADLEPVDVICGGFPCQPVSVAGLQRRQDDERWLWPEMARLIGELRPAFALMENVPGLYGGGLDDVLGNLSSLGFDAEWTCLPAASFGAPHLRERVFIVAYPSGFRRGSGPLMDTGNDLPYYDLWDASKGVSGWEGWKRWLNAVSKNGTAPDAYSEGRSHPERGTGPSESARGEIASTDDVGSGLLARVPQPVLLGVDDGIPNPLDRNRALGNAVVPQVAEYIGRFLMQEVEARRWSR